MKATGVIRRIDDLGRIVIPKEIRKNLKISEGDSLEIYVDDSNVIFKKYSILDNMISFSTKLADSFYKVYNQGIIITDKDKIIATSKNMITYLSKELASSIKDKISSRKEISELGVITLDLETKYYISPIIVNSDAIGSIIVLDDVVDKKTIDLLNTIFIKELEE